MSDIKAGDVVSIKSGGPRMVVLSAPENAGDRDLVYVQWFCEGSLEVREDRIALVVLVKCADQA